MNKHKKAKIMFAGALFLLLMYTITGCSFNQAYFQRNFDVTKAFEAFQILPDHTYYYSGPDMKPNAIIGINKDYSLIPGNWKAMVLTNNKMKKFIDTMKFQDGSEYSLDPNGAAIISPDGKQIGVWYSVWRYSTVKIVKDNQISIFVPMIIFPRKPTFKPI